MRIGPVAALALCACSTVPVAGEPPVRGGTSGYICHNEGLDQFVGQEATPELGAEMLRVSGARTIRWVQPGQVITMEFSQERLTVHLDAQNRVDSARCG